MSPTSTQSTPRLRLADHLRACVVDDQLLLLDLERNRYFGLTGHHAAVVTRAMGPHDGASSALTSEDPALIQPLLRMRILTTSAGNPQTQEWSPPSPSGASPPEEHDSDLEIRLPDTLRFLRAVALASLWLRWRSMRTIADAVGGLLHGAAADAANDPAQLRHSLRVFDRLRPLAFTARDKCLFDSLALAIFLGRQGLRASWVIGVSIRPFQAHSWIQDRDQVLNDVPENVRRFTPILVV